MRVYASSVLLWTTLAPCPRAVHPGPPLSLISSECINFWDIILLFVKAVPNSHAPRPLLGLISIKFLFGAVCMFKPCGGTRVALEVVCHAQY